MRAQPHTCDAFHLITFISLLSAFKLSWDTDEIQKGAAMWFFQFVMRRSSAAAHDLCLKPASSLNTPKAKQGALRTYLEVVKYPREVNATDDVTAVTDAA